MPTHMTSHPSVLAGKVQSFGLKNPDPYYYLVVFSLTVITELAGSVAMRKYILLFSRALRSPPKLMPQSQTKLHISSLK